MPDETFDVGSGETYDLLPANPEVTTGNGYMRKSVYDADRDGVIDPEAGGSGGEESGTNISLQETTPGSADTGNANLSGVLLAAKLGAGATSFGTNAKLVAGANVTTADNAANAAIGATATTAKPLILQGVASQSANLFECQTSAGLGFFTVGAGPAGKVHFGDAAHDMSAYSHNALLSTIRGGRVVGFTTTNSDTVANVFVGVPGAGTGAWFAHSNTGDYQWFESWVGGFSFKPGGTKRFEVTTAGVKINQGTEIKKVLSAAATLDFGTGPADLTVAVTGAVVGDVVAVGVPHGSVPSTGGFFGWVSAADTVTIRYTGSDDPASGSFRVMVTQF